MNLSSSVRRVAVVSAAGLVASIVTALPSSAATSAPLNYDCVSGFFTESFTVTADTDLPAAATAGAAVTGTVSYTFIFSEGLRKTLYEDSGSRFTEGTAVITTTVLGTPATVSTTLPRVAFPSSGQAALTGSGVVSVTAPTAAGSYDIVAEGYTTVIRMITEDGSPGVVLDFACTPVAGQNAVVDTLAVVAAPAPVVKGDSTTRVKATHAKKGHKAKVRVKVKGADGAVGSGRVKIVVKRGKKKVKSVAKKLNEKGVAKLVLKKLKKGKYTVKVKYAGSDTQNASKAKARFRVK